MAILLYFLHDLIGLSIFWVTNNGFTISTLDKFGFVVYIVGMFNLELVKMLNRDLLTPLTGLITDIGNPYFLFIAICISLHSLLYKIVETKSRKDSDKTGMRQGLKRAGASLEIRNSKHEILNEFE
jgi:uncharacterized membrane protein YuzA (DUF378 family)